MNAIALARCATAFLLVVFSVPIVMHLCTRWDAFDLPGPLKIHSRPVPRLGGIAVALAIAASLFLPFMSPAAGVWPFLSAIGIIWATGLIDDARGLSPVYRLGSQAAAALLLWLHGWRLPVPKAISATETLSLVSTIFFVIAMTNAFNLFDGADGAAAGVAIIIAAAYLALPGVSGSALAVAVAAGTVGACAGFLVFNFPPAKIFLGDSGSTVLGFLAAFLGLDFYRCLSGVFSFPSLAFPLLVAALPLLDAGLAIIRRLRHRRSPFHGDRRHFCDLLLVREWRQQNIALTGYGITFALVILAWCGLKGGPACSLAISLGSVGFLVMAGFRLGMLQMDDQAFQVESLRIRRAEEDTRDEAI
jgi:UDP-GlcNAc:undecaprenyl-phosphate GlcNAc-1-phosphate transferase